MAINFIEFSHPGKQISFTSKSGTRWQYNPKQIIVGLRYWNQDPSHYRKFFQVNAELDNGKTENVQFWGEFEAATTFERVKNNDYTQFPNAIHKPKFTPLDSNITPTDLLEKYKYQNTDPFCWEDIWKYQECRTQKYGFLRDLDKYSVIVMGTEYKMGFAVDTVFVVKESGLVSELFDKKWLFSDYYWQVTGRVFESLYIDRTTKNIIKPDHRWYNCITKEDNEPIWSFIPCKLSTPNGHHRFYMDYKKYNLQKPGAGIVCYRLKGQDGVDLLKNESIQMWNTLREDMINQGYLCLNKIKS